jgi:hypothetical protein
VTTLVKLCILTASSIMDHCRPVHSTSAGSQKLLTQDADRRPRSLWGIFRWRGPDIPTTAVCRCTFIPVGHGHAPARSRIRPEEEDLLSTRSHDADSPLRRCREKKKRALSPWLQWARRRARRAVVSCEQWRDQGGPAAALNAESKRTTVCR